MISLLTACTGESENGGRAATEILAQLNLPEKRRAKAAAIIACPYDFVVTGVLAAVADALAMPAIGCTAYVSGGDEASQTALDMQLSVAVFTDDDAEFAVAVGEIDQENYAAEISSLAAEAQAKLAGAPTLIIAALPTFSICGEILMKTLAAATGETPLFGMVANVAQGVSSGKCLVFGAGKVSPNRFAMLAIRGGNLSPCFFHASVEINAENLAKKTGTVTAADQEALYAVNGEPAKTYLQSIGMSEIDLIFSMPLLVDYGDGAWVTNSLTDLRATARGDAFYYNIEVPVGAKIAPAGEINYNVVMATAARMLKEILRAQAERPGSLLIVTSCIGRLLRAAPLEADEYEKIAAAFRGKIPFFYVSAGGEICPQKIGGAWRNQFHNFTCCAMLL